MMKYDKDRRQLQLYMLLLAGVIFLQLIVGVLGIAHRYCPQAVVCFGCLNLGQQLDNWIFPAAILLGAAIFIITIFIGRQFCGAICPFGTMQDLIYRLNKKASMGNKKAIIPIKLHGIMKYFKYLILLWVAVSAWLGSSYIFMQACPVLAIGHPQNITIMGIASLFIIFFVGYFVERFWCLYLCPYGALLNISQFMGRLLHLPRQKVDLSRESCINCKLCNNYCPMRIDIQQSGEINDVECIYCQRCRLCCPLRKK
jgi:polyferredoxin